MPNAHALVVGIANYQHINKLHPTVLQDARDIRWRWPGGRETSTRSGTNGGTRRPE